RAARRRPVGGASTPPPADDRARRRGGVTAGPRRARFRGLAATATTALGLDFRDSATPMPFSCWCCNLGGPACHSNRNGVESGSVESRVCPRAPVKEAKHGSPDVFP